MVLKMKVRAVVTSEASSLASSLMLLSGVSGPQSDSRLGRRGEEGDDSIGEFRD